jgi:capsular exopolysaccharide synthesis family protein
MSDIIETTEQQPPDDIIETPQCVAVLKRRAYDFFRGLWASLFYSGRTTGKIVLVCSPGRREGASTIACGLAIAGSEPAGVARVALVDLNLRMPNIHRMLRIEPDPGVAEVIADGEQPESIIRPNSPSLDVYPAGNVRGRVLEILRAKRLGSFLEDLASAYDYVLVDAAPVNQFPDAQVLAGAIKEALLVARTQRTPREAVAQAKKRLEAGGGRVVGLVLNLRTYPIPRFVYRRL